MIFKTRRKGALLVMSAPLLFMFSGLFLANIPVTRHHVLKQTR